MGDKRLLFGVIVVLDFMRSCVLYIRALRYLNQDPLVRRNEVSVLNSKVKCDASPGKINLS